MGFGLKGVSRRRQDALSQVDWQQFEHLLAAYYRRQGYDVEHTGTGHSSSRFDGGIDLKLRRGSEYIVVQVKHWNAYKVPHNDVHQLLGIMINERATGAIFVTSGEFTKAAVEAATRHGHVTLIDGDELRQMLGPSPDKPDTSRDWRESFMGTVSDRLLSAAEDRIRHGKSRATRTAGLGLGFVAAKAAIPLIILLLAIAFFQFFIRAATEGLQKSAVPAAVNVEPVRASQPPPMAGRADTTGGYPGAVADPCREIIDARTGSYIDHCASMSRSAAGAGKQPLTPEEIAESRRQADEAARIMSETTQEMPDPLPGSPPDTSWPRSPSDTAR